MDIKYEGLNLSALERNFNTLKEIVLEQRELIKTQKKDLRLCFARIEGLKKETKSDDVRNLFTGLTGKKD